MTQRSTHLAGLPQLDIHTLSEDWALATALQAHWAILAREIGLPPGRWFDSGGDRMYGAVVALSTDFDLGRPVVEDDEVEAVTEVLSVRRPHALSLTRYSVAGETRAEVRLLTSFVKRSASGSNKKFAKVRELWHAEDRDPAAIDALLDRHHRAKATPDGPLAMSHEVNRIRDFNTADFMYFKTFVAIAKAAEWRENRGRPARLNAHREAWFFGNVEDGEEVRVHVGRDGDQVATTLRDPSGRLLLASDAVAPTIAIAPR